MKYPHAADGLRLMFIGEILSIVGIFLTLILIGPVVFLIGGIMSLVGLYRAREDDEGYNTAFRVKIAGIAVNLIGVFFSSGFIGGVLDIAGTIISLAVLYYAVNTTANLLYSVGESKISERGKTVWTINLICTVVSVIITVLAYVPLLNILAAAAAVVMLIVQLVGYILYLVFLYGSYRAL